MIVRHLNMRLFALIAVLLLSTLLGSGQDTARRSPSGSHQPKLKEVLSWLPEDTESIIGMNGPFPLPDLTAQSSWNRSERLSAQLEVLMRRWPLFLLRLKNGGLQKSLTGKTVALAIEGSRRFWPASGSGKMRYEGCEIVVFDRSAALDQDSFMKNAASSAVRLEEMAGAKVAVFEEWLDMDLWTTFVGFPQTNIVLVGSTADCLRVVLMRMQHPSGPRALPDNLPEWKYVNTRAPLWGWRHYQKQREGLDTISPFAGPDDANVPDKLAVGLAFWVAPSVPRATVAYLSGNRNARQILLSHVGLAHAYSATPREFQIRLRQRGPDVIEGSVKLSGFDVSFRFLAGLIGMIGHVVP